jgi:Zn-dependent peptidase ImmA (M78 family)
MTITTRFEGYTKVAQSLINLVALVVSLASSLNITEDVTVIVHNVKAAGNRGLYVAEDVVVGSRVITKGHIAHIYAKGLTDSQLRFALAHELGHAEHSTSIPQSATWTSVQKEGHANTVAHTLLNL